MGFGASFVFGTFVGGFADTLGRKRAALLYCFFYIVSCLTKHVNNYHVLMFGRVTGGIATSLLFSVFESWLVSEHNQRHHFPQRLLSYSFSLMYSVNFLVAIVTGLVADRFVEVAKLSPSFGSSSVYFGGYLFAFDAAILANIIGGTYIALVWNENYGSSDGVCQQLKGFATGFVEILQDSQMAMCCLIIALFESSMYIFVFNWTPVISPEGAKTETPPFGMIFSTFMMCCMTGASVFSLLSSRFAPKTILTGTLAVAACSMALPAFFGGAVGMVPFNLWSFLVFEFCCGMYFPAICTLKSEAVPESQRSTVYNLFRAPMNAIVMAVLLINPSLESTFRLVCNMLVLATIIAGVVTYVSPGHGKKDEKNTLV
jgi:MFS family permease